MPKTMTSRRTLCAALGSAPLLALGARLAFATERPAPDFRLQVRGGDALSLSELRGKVVMINFWATWCAPCRQEMPLLDQIYRRYQDLGFTLLGVNVERDSRLADVFLRDTPVSFPILLDPEEKVSRLYDVAAMPSTVLVDRQGNLRKVFHGYRPGDENKYQDAVRQLIRERT